MADAVADFAKKSGKDVLICWEHDALTKIVEALGEKKAPGRSLLLKIMINSWLIIVAPADYPSDSYDLIWKMQKGKLLSTDTSENCPGLD